jgi:hypothetical protein
MMESLWHLQRQCSTDDAPEPLTPAAAAACSGRWERSLVHQLRQQWLIRGSVGGLASPSTRDRGDSAMKDAMEAIGEKLYAATAHVSASDQ